MSAPAPLPGGALRLQIDSADYYRHTPRIHTVGASSPPTLQRSGHRDAGSERGQMPTAARQTRGPDELQVSRARGKRRLADEFSGSNGQQVRPVNPLARRAEHKSSVSRDYRSRRDQNRRLDSPRGRRPNPTSLLRTAPQDRKHADSRRFPQVPPPGVEPGSTA